MKGKKRFIKKFFKILLFIIYIVAVITFSNVIFNVIFDDMQNEQKIKSDYEEKKQKCEMLHEVADSTIQEGICIDIGKIPNDVDYQIKNDNEIILSKTTAIHLNQEVPQSTMQQLSYQKITKF